MTQTEIPIDVRDIGRRLAGLNVEIPAEIAIAEVCDAIDALTEDLHIRTNISYEETGHASQSQGIVLGIVLLLSFLGAACRPSTARRSPNRWTTPIPTPSYDFRLQPEIEWMKTVPYYTGWPISCSRHVMDWPSPCADSIRVFATTWDCDGVTVVMVTCEASPDTTFFVERRYIVPK